MGGESVKEASQDFKTITTAYKDYADKGGRLDPESFEMLNTFQGLDESQIDESYLETNRSWPESIGGFTGREVDMYVLLRTLPPEDDRPVASGRKPQGLGDHELLAEILRVTDPAKREKFVKKYPKTSGRTKKVI